MTEAIEMILSAKSIAAVVAVMSLIQVAPIKINPWTWILSFVGREMNGELIGKIRHIEDEVKSIRHEIGEDRADTARVRILRFNDELLEGKLHTKDAFDQCLADVDNYERYCKEHQDYKNNMTVMSIRNIKRCYENCMNQRDFVGGAACRLPFMEVKK